MSQLVNNDTLDVSVFIECKNYDLRICIYRIEYKKLDKVEFNMQAYDANNALIYNETHDDNEDALKALHFMLMSEYQLDV
jgi:hypothetical protein